MKIFNKINYYIYNIYIIYIVKFYFPYLPHVSENCHLSSVIVLTFLPDAFNRPLDMELLDEDLDADEVVQNFCGWRSRYLLSVNNKNKKNTNFVVYKQ